MAGVNLIMALEPGKRFGAYEVIESIGSGGMGEVYRARDTDLKRDVAIKVLPLAFVEEADRLARFQREAEILASLNHPNIATIHRIEKADDQTVLVMELVEGPTLADRIAQGPIPPDEAIGIALQIVAALETAHYKQIVHRDLKPANVKVRDDGTVKVLDFGISKPIDTTTISGSSPIATTPAVTRTGVILGTAAYMSPEQARGRLVDQRTDIWAFGCLLFEMLTGQPAFAGEDVMAILARVIDRDTDFGSMPTSISPALRHTIKLCLQKDPSKRLGAIGDVRLGLEGAFEGEALAVRTRASNTRAALPWIFASLGIFLAALAAWSFKPVPEVSSSLVRFPYVLPDGQQFSQLTRQAVAISVDSTIVYVANGQLFSKALDSLEATPIPGTNESPSSPFFSPDGQWIGYRSSDGRLKKIPVSGGAPVPIAEGTDPISSPSWGADNMIVWSQPGGVKQVSANGGVPVDLVPGGTLRSPQILPDGDSLLMHVGTQTGIVVVQSLQTGERKELFTGVYPKYLPSGHIVYAVDSVLYVVPFDLDTLEVTGAGVPMVEPVRPLHYAVATSGSLIYIPASSAVTSDLILSWVDRNGVLEPLPLPPRPYRHPRISPDGTRLAVQTIDDESGQSHVWIYDLNGDTQMQQLAGAGNRSRPIWTPDSERLTFTSDEDGTESIWWQLADGSQPAEQLTQADLDLPHWPDAWSPDGGTLAFTKYRTGEQHVWTLTVAEGAGPIMIAGGLSEQQAGGADFSRPDGRWIAYRSNEGGEHIQVQPYPPTGAIYKTALAGGAYPMWSPDSGELFYRRAVTATTLEGPRLLGVEVAIDGAPRFTNERVLPTEGMQVFFGNRDYDISPDGERFLVIRAPADAASAGPPRQQIDVVLNWLDEVDERAPSR
jgi:serine/threonine protein kinase